MIFTGFDGTQLFINSPEGHTIYAHRVSGDPMERAKEVIASNTVIVTDEPEKADKMICLNERKTEFTEALSRGKDNRLEVFSDWDKDAFVVVNHDNNAEYRVNLESRDGQLWGECECPDFSFRRRICKHTSAVLTDCLFSVAVKS